MKFGTDTYRAGAMDRVADASLLLANGHWGGAVYAAGLAVEGMLRSLVWLRDKQFDERHDLRRLAIRIENLGLLRSGDADLGFVAMVQDVSARWHNNLRFAANDHLVRAWMDAGLMPRKDSSNIRVQCMRFVDQCSEAVKRCEVLWHRQQRTSSKKS